MIKARVEISPSASDCPSTSMVAISIIKFPLKEPQSFPNVPHPRNSIGISMWNTTYLSRLDSSSQSHLRGLILRKMYLGQDFLADLWLALERNSNFKVVQSSSRLSGHVRISIANSLGLILVCGNHKCEFISREEKCHPYLYSSFIVSF